VSGDLSDHTRQIDAAIEQLLVLAAQGRMIPQLADLSVKTK
jgi:hypothetical protein